MEQISLWNTPDTISCSRYLVEHFSSDDFCDDTERRKLEKKYSGLLCVSSVFDRQYVSYQLSKSEILHSWLKYKEGFSAELVNRFLDDMDAKAGDIVMDPFMGSGTTALVCQARGIDSIGYDVMPISAASIKAKQNIIEYDTAEISEMIDSFKKLELPTGYEKSTPYIRITESAYPKYNEKFIQYATDWIESSAYSEKTKSIFTLCMLNSLESCSYTSKSGQYLSWDSRSEKITEANKKRERDGKKLYPYHLCRKDICNIKDAVFGELNRVLNDIIYIQREKKDPISAHINFKQNSVLFELPKVQEETISGVITSPPYCNRYDYTRTYALELVYLGVDEESIKRLRQELLSCTVENKSKIDSLRDFYVRIGQTERFDKIYETIMGNKVFSEILTAINKRKENGDLNNKGVVRMIEGYFVELAFTYAELYRVCKKGATVVFVNDNVRYGGEVIPVDFLSTNFAEEFGFTPISIQCLKQQKGNSSQQMKKYGRVPLRKSITVWKKL